MLKSYRVRFPLFYPITASSTPSFWIACLTAAVLLLDVKCAAIALWQTADTKHKQQSGFYKIEKRAGVWSFVTPTGEPFFSLGVNVVDMGIGPSLYKPENPAYSALRIYADELAWRSATQKRLLAWGFNTLGGWSDAKLTGSTLPFAPVLHMGSQAGAPWADLFSKEFEQTVDGIAQEKVTPFRDNPNLIGWFPDNEIGWWEDSLFLHFVRQPDSNATHRALIKLLTGRYSNIDRFRADFLTSAASISGIGPESLVKLRPGGHGMLAVHDFMRVLADRYYSCVSRAIRKYDPNHLLLGDRYANHCPPEVAQAAGKFMDVVSTNFYCADWTTGPPPRFYLESLCKLSHRPILISEFYCSAKENRSGNRNSSAEFPVVARQSDRAQFYRDNVAAWVDLPFMVGAHWFQYSDEPGKGRADGEDYDMGLVDVQDQPYEELTNAASQVNIAALQDHLRPRIPNRSVPFKPPITERAMQGVQGWDRVRAFVPSTSFAPQADLYIAQDKARLYLAVYAAEFVDLDLYKDKRLPDGEETKWSIQVAGKPPVVIRFVGGARVSGMKGATVRSWAHATRRLTIVSLPLDELPKTVKLESVLSLHSRSIETKWSSKFAQQ